MKKIIQGYRIYRFYFPWFLLRKQLARFFWAETVIIYSHDMRHLDVSLRTITAAVEVVRIDDIGAALFKELCASFPNRHFDLRIQHEQRQCYVAIHNQKISGYAWVARGSLYIDEISWKYHMGKQEIFIYDCFVNSESRGQGIYPFLLDAVMKDQRASSSALLCAFIASSAMNHASIRGIRKAGFVERKRIRYLQWRQRQHWWELTSNAGAPFTAAATRTKA